MAHKMRQSITILFSLLLLASIAQAYGTISGTVTYKGAGLGGVVITGLPGEPVTDASGHYSSTIPYPTWTGRAIPMLDGYAFTPPHITY